jgi:fibronectin type 3 domain-containing protein
MLEWSPSSDERLAGYNIYRTNLDTRSRLRLNEKPLDRSLGSFTSHQSSIPAEFVSYSLSAIDKAGFESRASFEYLVPVRDMTPPSSPDYFHTWRNANVVALSWSRSKSIDAKGYELERSASNKEQFSALHGNLLRDSVFLDTLEDRIVNGQLRYRLRSVDTHGNASKWTDSISTFANKEVKVKAPDVAASATKARVVLKWFPERQQKIQGYYINRYDDTLSTPVTLNSEMLSSTINSFTDNTVLSGKTYWYELVSVDENFDFSNPSSRIVTFTGTKSQIYAPYIDSALATKEGVVIQWRWKGSIIPVGEVIIQRSQDGISFMDVSQPLPSSRGVFVDANPAATSSTTYYRLRFRIPGGLESDPSSTVMLK